MPASEHTADVSRPSVEQEVLLRACLRRDERALASWQDWCERVDFDDLDAGSQRLVPLLYRNLVGLGCDQQLLGRYRGIYRKAWYENQLHLRDLRRVLTALDAVDVSCLVLKGIPLALSCYEEIAQRPMADIDLLVLPEDAPRTAQVLRDLGYNSEEDAASDLSSEFVDSVNATSFVCADRSAIDLHWRVFLDSWRHECERGFWETAETLEWKNTSLRAMCPSDLFLHVCVHGVAWNPTPPLRWIPDAVMILRSRGDDFDWPMLVSRARDLGVVVPLREALAYLAALLPEELPSGQPWSELGGLRPTRREMIHHRVAVSSPRSLGWGEPLWFYYVRHFGPRVAADGWWTAIRSFPRFLQVSWGLERLDQVPVEASRKLVHRLRSGGRRRTSDRG